MTAQQSVVITGASTGIGAATAHYLDERGYRVFAGVRREEDATRLKAESSERLHPLILDVTDADQIAAAAQTVAATVGQAGLAGLVNNAGISLGGPIEYMPVDDLRQVLEVNLIGAVAVTQAMMPLLHLAKGRIINMSSLSGRVAVPLTGSYAMSKFALEAFSDVLRREVNRFGIEVVVIEPGAIDTPIWNKTRERIDQRWNELSPEVMARYRKTLEHARDNMTEIEGALPPEVVARVVHKALTAKRPRTRYPIGPDARITLWMNALLTDRMLDRILRRFMKAD